MRVLKISLLLISFLSCQQNPMKLDKKEFSISYPSHLILDESGREGTVFTLSTEKENETDVFLENIHLVTKNIGNTNFDEFVTQAEKEIRSYAKVVETERLKVNNVDGTRMIIKATQNNINLVYIQHLFLKNNKLYVLTFSSEEKVYDKYYEQMNGVMMSFIVK